MSQPYAVGKHDLVQMGGGGLSYVNRVQHAHYFCLACGAKASCPAGAGTVLVCDGLGQEAVTRDEAKAVPRYEYKGESIPIYI